MASKKVTLSIPHRLWDAMVDFAPKAGYKNANELLIWSAFYAVIVGKPHVVTAPIAQSSRDVQDIFVEDLLAAKERGELDHGSYLEHIIEDLMKRFGLAEKPDVMKAVIAETVRNRPKSEKPRNSTADHK